MYYLIHFLDQRKGMNRKIWFCSYGDERFKHSIIRIEKEAENFGFDKVITYTFSDLPDEMRKDPIMKYSRGGGYYIWKPWIIYRTLEQMNEGDILFYLDAGCSIKYSEKGRETFRYYIEMLEERPVLTCLTAKKPRIPGFSRYYEYQWTKMDLFNYLNGHKFKDQIQVCSGFFGVRKCDDSLAFVNEWKKVVRISHLVDDSTSVVCNYPGFVENRHDQSILSLLVRKYDYKILEDQILRDKIKYPFWATRLRN